MLFLRPLSAETSVKKAPACVFAFCWTLFLTAGIFIGERCSQSAALILQCISDLQVSLFPAVLFRLIVLLSSLVFAHLQFYGGLLFLTAGRGLGFGFLVGSTWTLHGNAGWLVCLLTYFSSTVCLAVELWSWISLIRSKKRMNIIYGLIAFILELSALLIQLKIVSPFISGII